MNRISWTLVVIATVVFGFALWVTDGITLKGERTIYTVDCEGRWQRNTCEGNLIPWERFRFVARKRGGEVLVWVVGSPKPSHKYINCDISNGRNWRCQDNGTLSETITREMLHGKPVKDMTGKAIAFHQVSKLRWHLLLYGIPTGNTSED